MRGRYISHVMKYNEVNGREALDEQWSRAPSPHFMRHRQGRRGFLASHDTQGDIELSFMGNYITCELAESFSSHLGLTSNS